MDDASPNPPKAAPGAAGAAPAAAPSAPPSVRAERGRTRQRLFTLLGAVVAGAAVIFGLYWLIVGRNHVTTDDAYVDASSAQITPLVSGRIISAPVNDTQVVKAGDILVVLDPADYQVALDKAQAQLAQAERKVRGYYATDEALAGQSAAREADVASAAARVSSAQADVQKAQVELKRRQALAGSGAVSGDELTAAQNAAAGADAALKAAQAGLAQARANQTAAQGQRHANAALIAGSDVANNPEVAAARAAVAQARLDLDRTVIRAPFAGVVARNAIQIGQRVEPGAQLMTVVPIQTAHVNANFKEVQLRKVRLGQPVTLTSDLYGGGVKFHGRVEGLAGGTGSAFALIPAQNATGNWIKVVQRLPVRIALDPRELAQHPLRVGLSMKADIDVAGAR